MVNRISQDNIDKIPEIRLVRGAKSGSKEDFCALYGLYKDRLYRYALYRLGDATDAEDAVSECVMAAWKDIRSLRDDHAFSAWIFRILHNICAGMIRKKIESREALEKAAESLPLVSDAGASKSAELADALSRLTDEEREIILLSVVSGLTSKEISGITGITPGSCRSKLSRSLAKMREILS